MAEELFPVFDVPETEEEEYDADYKRSVRWDPQIGDFSRDRSNRMIPCDGQEAYMIWCYKMVQTERDSHLAYLENVSGSDLGVDMAVIAQEGDHETVESMIQRTMTEALELNPRTESVGNFNFSWNGDAVHCWFEVRGVGMDHEIQISF